MTPASSQARDGHPLNAPRHALVLGAAGFVGRYVTRALADQGWHVTGLGHGRWPRETWQAWGISAWHHGDVDAATLAAHAGKPDLIVQCAGGGSVADSITDPAKDFHRTVTSTLCALDYIRLHAPACRLVLPSSAAVYGAAEHVPIPIDAPRHPQSPYGFHKAMAEDLCRSHGQTYGVSTAIVRLFSIYGSHLRKQLPWDACTKLSQGAAVFGGTGHERRDWLHARDAAELLIMAGTHATPACPVVNGGSGTSTEICEAVTVLRDALGNGADIAFSETPRHGDPNVYEADISDALAWGWTPRRKLVDGLSDYARWFRNEAC
jgi:UDP-glucose 4-epimerase